MSVKSEVLNKLFSECADIIRHPENEKHDAEAFKELKEFCKNHLNQNKQQSDYQSGQMGFEKYLKHIQTLVKKFE